MSLLVHWAVGRASVYGVSLDRDLLACDGHLQRPLLAHNFLASQPSPVGLTGDGRNGDGAPRRAKTAPQHRRRSRRVDATSRFNAMRFGWLRVHPWDRVMLSKPYEWINSWQQSVNDDWAACEELRIARASITKAGLAPAFLVRVRR